MGALANDSGCKPEPAKENHIRPRMPLSGIECRVRRDAPIINEEGTGNDNHNTQTANDSRRNFSVALTQDKGDSLHADLFPGQHLVAGVLCQPDAA